MPEQEPTGRRGSDVLDAIWDKVADKPERSESAQVLFRARALEQLDVATEVDNQLPLVSRRSWLLLVGVAILVLGLLTWAALTPSVVGVTAPGRTVAPPGTLPVAATAPGILLETSVQSGQMVSAGQEVAQIGGEGQATAVRATQEGVAWQVLVVPGEAVAAGQPILTLLPPGSDRSALLAVPEQEASTIATGMAVDGFGVPGTVTAVGAPLPAADASLRTGLTLAEGTNYRLVDVGLSSPAPPGSAVTGRVILSDETVLGRLLGSS